MLSVVRSMLCGAASDGNSFTFLGSDPRLPTVASGDRLRLGQQPAVADVRVTHHHRLPARGIHDARSVRFEIGLEKAAPDSHRGSSDIAERHVQARAYPLPHPELVVLGV